MDSPIEENAEKLGFLDFLEDGKNRGGFETDDALAAILPLLEQVQSIHSAGKVAPLVGLMDLQVTAGHVWFENARAKPVRSAPEKLSQIERERSRAFEIVGARDYTRDLDDEFGSTAANLLVGDPGDSEEEETPKTPIYLTRYCSWEHLAGHHDALTDIYSLGMLLASVALNLDFCDRVQLTAFVETREHLLNLNPRLHPSVAAMISRMTALHRHERIQDLSTIIAFLKNYRDQPDIDEFDFSQIKGFEARSRNDKRTLINERLRDRLFELSKRNRLVYFKSTLQTVNLTIGSVPLLLDFENIRPDRILTWNEEISGVVKAEKTISLNRFLQFEDAPWLPGALDGIRRDSNRDIKEYGFAQLRMVIVFLRWHNLKENPTERIHSPLLLLPVSLNKKKGIRDSYNLVPGGSVAEVNPALRYYLKQLYDLNLPESIDLAETSVDVFFDLLKQQIQASEPAIELKKIDRPQVDLIYEKAKKRLDLYRKRQRMSGRAVKSWGDIDYSYSAQNFQPLGLQLFLQKVKPTPLPLDYLLSGKPQLRAPGIIDNDSEPETISPPATPKEKITKKEMYSMREGSGNNPYVWDFDLCSLTLGNFNYRKMTLVRDYNTLLSEERDNPAFDEIFSLNPKDREEPPPAPELREQYLIVPSDPTQVSAITWARTGRNLIIQGPPGTGKSQTITNLIADYVALGKRVLFVCEKRAALDVVYHRLGQSGLDRLACLIHDSQSDKKGFIMDLKATYEGFLSGDELVDEEGRCDRLAKTVAQELAVLERFGEAMNVDDSRAAVTLRELLERLIILREAEPELDVELEEALPFYKDWIEHGDKVKQLTATLRDLGKPPVYAKSPVSSIGKESITADNPVSRLRGLLEETRPRVERLAELARELPFPLEVFSFTEWTTATALCSAAQYLSSANLLTILNSESNENRQFSVFGRKVESVGRKLDKQRELTANWQEKLSPRDTETALDLARTTEGSFLKFLKPAFWRLRKLMMLHYNFGAHAIKPSWSQVLKELNEEHDIVQQIDDIDEEICIEFGVDDAQSLRESIQRFTEAKTASKTGNVSELSDFIILGGSDANTVVNALAGFADELSHLDSQLGEFLRDHEKQTVPGIESAHKGLRENLDTLPELLPDLNDLVETPDAFFSAIGQLEWEIEGFESAMARKSLNSRYREDRALNRFEGWVLRRHTKRADDSYREWMKANGPRIVNRVRAEFLEAYKISNLPAAQLTPEQKLFKKAFNKGRRELEHEFGKTMRYRSIRDLAGDESGGVVMKLKPIWLMSPLSISDTLPLETGQFDVVIFDEASQIKLEEAVPTVFRAAQVIVVGDEMQLPPTNFFSTATSDEDELLNVEEAGEVVEYDLSAESFLSHSAQNLPSTFLGWHYRSRHEALISYSNNAFYSGELLTIPDRKAALGGDAAIRANSAEEAIENTDELLARSISFHFLEHGVYDTRRNPAEAEYIAHTVRELLSRNIGLSIGIVAFSEAQQDEIDSALNRLSRLDEEFGNQLAIEVEREEDDQFCGLFVKNLENVQGDERDVIILSICYAPDHNGKMRMNFGPINQSGGEKRLNVIFSRAKVHMVVVSSIQHHQITNDYNDGANCLKGFLEYSAAVSRGDAETAARVLQLLNTRTDFSAPNSFTGKNAVIDQLSTTLEARGYEVSRAVGQSRFKTDLAVREAGSDLHQVGILIDGDDHYAVTNPLERYLLRPGILRAFGWTVFEVLAKDWYHAPEEILTKIDRLLKHPEETLEEAPEESVETFFEELREEEAPVEVEQTEIEFVPEPEPGGETAGEEAVPEKASTYLEFTGQGSFKFWEVTQEGDQLSVRYGRIGNNGQTQTKKYESTEAARLQAEKLIDAKIRKGYEEKSLS